MAIFLLIDIVVRVEVKRQSLYVLCATTAFDVTIMIIFKVSLG